MKPTMKMTKVQNSAFWRPTIRISIQAAAQIIAPVTVWTQI
jgi:hypothetical protein